ncbi:MAG: TRAP transporter substrate-binding protein DctP [Acidobacteria bacterium]|nr:TRAP transporter substrate-binding protein DctP [Acidobacteriota bacterium]
MRTIRKLYWLFVCILLFSIVQDSVWAKDPIRIRIGTSAPKNSLWNETLMYLKQDWIKISNSELEISILAGGVLGDEPEMVKMLRAGRIEAVGLSSVGLSRIDKSIACLQIPMMLRSYEELDYVRDRIAPRLEQKLEEKGFKILHWADAGWVHTFAKKPARTPGDLQKMKLFTAAGDPETEKLYKEFGYHVVPLSQMDVIPSLQNGMIDAFNLPPLYTLINESYRQAPHMIGVKWTPLVAGTVISLKVWQKMPEKYRPQMLEAARKAGNRLRSEIRKMGEDSIGEMQKRGLKVVELDAATLAAWQLEAEKAYPKLRDRYTPADLFDEVQRLRDEFRKSGGPSTAKR